MSKEYLATKLISGKSDASMKTQWWPKHSRGAARYLDLSWGDGDPAGLKSIRECLFSGCRDWEIAVLRSSKPGLMEEHAVLEIELVEAVVRGNVDRINRIGDLLVANVKNQTELYTAKFDHFPVRTWHDLFNRHVGLFIESTQHRAANDDRNFVECEERRQVNTLALAAFTAEWL